LGIKSMVRWKFRTIEVRVVERDIGEAVIECLGERQQGSLVSLRKVMLRY